MNNLFPWYDANWLANYVRSKFLIQNNYPHKYSEFIKVLDPLRTRQDFEAIKIDNIFENQTMKQIKNLLINLKKEDLEKHELLKFGRWVIHNHPFFNDLQKILTPLVSDLVNEKVEPSYNFLSLYNNLGVCAMHMDAPSAKYTLDVCLKQSQPWPIYLSQVQPWPEKFPYQKDWEKSIKDDPNNIFTPYTLNEGQAVIFSGSSQWHYRERIAKQDVTQKENNFCHLIFFHFIPAGMQQIINPQNWANLFDIPELLNVVIN